MALVADNPYNIKSVILNIETLIDRARKSNVEVIFVQHDGGSGDVLEKNTAGWEIDNQLRLQNHEKVFDKEYNSAFKETGLHGYLQNRFVDTIILTGMQTEYCIDATCKSAYDLGYSLVIPTDTTTTFDNSYFSGGMLAKYFEEKIWNNRFAKVIPLDEIEML